MSTKREIHRQITQQMRDGKITRKERIKLLKEAGIGPIENIELDNAFREIEDSELRLSGVHLDDFDPDIQDIIDLYDSRGNK